MKRLNLPKERTFEGPASLWKRVLAFAIDMLILNFFVLYPFRTLFANLMPSDAGFSDAYSIFTSNNGYAKEFSIIAFFMSLLAIMYFALLERRFGQTIGKHFLNLHVISENNELKRWQSFTRSIFILPAFPFILLWIIDPLFMLFNKTGQRLSEILSKTKVTEKYNLNEGW